MSEEPVQPSPSLRLKPRLRPADEQAPAAPSSIDLPNFIPPLPTAAAVNPAEAPSPDSPPTPKIRFKPRLESAASPADDLIAPVAPASPNQGVSPVLGMENPRVTAPAPPLFVTPAAPVMPPAPPLSEPTPPSVIPPPAPATAPAVDGGKFKLKPKLSPPPGVSTSAVAAAPSVVPPPVLTSAPPAVARSPLAPPAAAVKAPPPFPVIAPTGAGKAGPPPSMPPKVPLAVAGTGAAPTLETRPPIPERKKSSGSGLLKIVGLIVVGCAGFVVYKQYMPAPAASAPPTNTPPANAVAPAAPAAVTNSSPTPSETLNNLAHAPANAINKAHDAIATRRASGQSRIDAASIGEDLPDAPSGPAPAAPLKQGAAAKSAAPATSTTTALSPGVAATAHVEAAPEAAAPFRSFVANAKVSGVFQGPPSRAVINGRLTRVGEIVDATLGVTFEGVDSSRRHLIFKDAAGATVSRRF